MNRRRFMELLGLATVGTGIAYSFPSIIVPKNIITVPEFAHQLVVLNSAGSGFVHNAMLFEQLASADFLQAVGGPQGLMFLKQHNPALLTAMAKDFGI